MAAVEIQSVKFWHEAIIDRIIASEGKISQGEIAREFGYTQAWMSIIINSDAFQHRLAERKAQLVDPSLASVAEKKAAAASRALDRLLDRLDNTPNLKISELTDILSTVAPSRENQTPVVQQSFAFHLPPPAADPQSWLQNTSRKVIDISPRNEGD